MGGCVTQRKTELSAGVMLRRSSGAGSTGGGHVAEEGDSDALGFGDMLGARRAESGDVLCGTTGSSSQTYPRSLSCFWGCEPTPHCLGGCAGLGEEPSP